MCGIIGRFSKNNEYTKSLKALKILEYRGYDSFGILFSNFKNPNKNDVFKDKGSINSDVLNKLILENKKSNIEIGHTRWATHGNVSKENAHPVFNEDKNIFVVMNGVIDNFYDIKNFLISKNYKFTSQTDTQIIPILFDYYLKQIKSNKTNSITIIELKQILKLTLSNLKGEFSFLLKFENFLIGYKNSNPLILGEIFSQNNLIKNKKTIETKELSEIQKNEKIDKIEEIFICSDLNIIEQNSQNYYILEDEEIFIASFENENIHLEFNKIQINTANFEKTTITQITKNKILNTNSNSNSLENINQISQINQNNKDNTNITKNKNNQNIFNSNYYMEKEILEQKNLTNFFTDENILNLKKIYNEIFKFQNTNNNSNIILTAAGSSYHACYFLHYKLLKMGIKTDIILASELDNYIEVFKKSKKNLFIVLSQSGETADLIYPLKKINHKDDIFLITNTKNSTLDRISKTSIYLNCGKEIAVASTKAFLFQILFAKVLEFLNRGLNLKEIKTQFKNFHNIFEDVINQNKNILTKFCNKFTNSNNLLFIGRDDFFPLALEGALKLKEISYINAQGFPAGELKHGSLSLIDENVGIVALGINRKSNSLILNNIEEIKSRGGKVLGIGDFDNQICNFFCKIEEDYEDFNEILTTILLQFIALKITLNKNLNPDKPRNLAKSVTVR